MTMHKIMFMCPRIARLRNLDDAIQAKRIHINLLSSLHFNLPLSRYLHATYCVDSMLLSHEINCYWSHHLIGPYLKNKLTYCSTKPGVLFLERSEN